MHVFSFVHFLIWNWGCGVDSVKVVGLSNSVHSHELFLVSVRIERNKTRDLEQTRTWHRLTQRTNWFDTIRTPDLILHTWQMCRRSCRYRTAMPYTQFIDVQDLPRLRCVCLLFVRSISKRTNQIFMMCHVDGLNLKSLNELNFVLKRYGIYHSVVRDPAYSQLE